MGLTSYLPDQLTWFQGLNVGDKIALDQSRRWEGLRRYLILECIKTTPTTKVFEAGRLTLKCRTSDGLILGGHHDLKYRRVEEITDSVKKEIEFAATYDKAKNILNALDGKLGHVSLAVLQKLCEISDLVSPPTGSG